MAAINIEEIMKEIRASAQDNGSESVPDFDSIAQSVWDDCGFNKIRFNELLYDLNHSWNVQPERPIQTVGGLRGKIYLLIKHVARKMIRFYIMPIVVDQNSFNSHVVSEINELGKYIEEHSIDECSVQYSELKHRVDAVLAKKVAALEQQNETLQRCVQQERAERERLQKELARLNAAVESLRGETSCEERQG